MTNENTLAPPRQKQVKQAIAELVKELPKGTHLTAPEVYRAAKDAGVNVSLSTVYRTLNNLQAHGNVTALGSDRGRRYESSGEGEDHDHLICVKCGLTIEFFDDLIRGFGKSVAQRKGFEHKSSRFDILGLCAECKSKDEDHRIEAAVGSLEAAVESLEEAIAICKQSIVLFESRKVAKGKHGADFAARKAEAALGNCQECVDLFTDG
jgi:Fur family ferric uptake transcriptional regulator